jgi:hypothetical protein
MSLISTINEKITIKRASNNELRFIYINKETTKKKENK